MGRPGGPKTGGRVKGVKNKRTQQIEDIFRRYQFDPISSMIEMCQEETTTKELKGILLKELAQYQWPKRKAIEHSGGLTVDTGVLDARDVPTEEDLAIASGRRNGNGT